MLIHAPTEAGLEREIRAQSFQGLVCISANQTTEGSREVESSSERLRTKASLLAVAVVFITMGLFI